MDRHTTNKAKLSLGFTDFIVAPLFTNLVKLLPAGTEAIASMAQNRKKYSAMYESEMKANKTLHKDKLRLELKAAQRRTTLFNKMKRRASLVDSPTNSDGPPGIRLSKSFSPRV